MDFVNKILAYINSSGTPELYYIGIAVAVIFAFFILEKIFKMMLMLAVIAAIAFGFSALQGNNPNGSISSIKASFDKIFAGTSSTTSGTPATNNTSSSAASSSNSSSTNSDSNGSYITGNKKTNTIPSPSGSDSTSGTATSLQDSISGFLSTLTGGK